MNKKLKEKLLSLPTTSGVYLMKDLGGNIIYVGKAKNLKRRVNSYFVGNDKPLKTLNLVENIEDFDYILTSSDTDAFLLENNLIKKYQPHFNILLKDGKNYPYIKIDTTQNFPKVEITRKVKNDGAKYFGPYFNGISVQEIMSIISRAFLLRTCNLKLGKKNARPCLNYEIGLCSAPCANFVSEEEYQKQVFEVIEFLKGDTKRVEQILSQKMQLASDAQNYERALQIRDEIRSLYKLKQKYTAQFPTLFNEDVVGYYSTGTNAVFTVMIIRDGKLMGVENFSLLSIQSFEQIASTFLIQYYQNRQVPKKVVLMQQIVDLDALQEYLSKKSLQSVQIVVAKKGKNMELCKLATQNGKEYLEKSLGVLRTKQMKTVGAIERLKDVLHLSAVPYRIECYDISHTSGTNSVASMVVFLNGDVAKSHYRKFNIKADCNDDFLSMKEVLLRRIGELKNSADQSFSSLPNLIVIDGGKGQLSSVQSILEQLDVSIPLCSLAKQQEEIFVTWQSDAIKLPKSDVALQVLQRIRDEAHRFAITSHRARRTKSMTKSVLDQVKGIGKAKKQMLFEKFGTLDAIKNASKSEIMLIKGITDSQAQAILDVLNN